MGLSSVQNIMIGLILFLVVIGSGVYMVGTFVSIHDSSLDPNNLIQNFTGNFYQNGSMNNAVNNMQSNLGHVSVENGGLLGWLNALIAVVYAGVTTLFSSLGFVSSMLFAAANTFGIPSFVVSLFFSIIILIIIYAIWQAVMRVL